MVARLEELTSYHDAAPLLEMAVADIEELFGGGFAGRSVAAGMLLRRAVRLLRTELEPLHTAEFIRRATEDLVR